MAGTNGKPKFQPVNREEEIEDLKVRGTVYHYKPPTNVILSPISLDQWFSANVNIFPAAPNPILAPTADQIYQYFSQEAPGVVGETAQVLIANHDTIARTVTLGAQWNPTSLTLAPASQYEMLYRIISVNPVMFQIVELVPAGSTNPALNATPAAATFGNDFSLVPSAPFDVVVRNATNTAWVPSQTALTGGRAPWMDLGGGVASARSDILTVNDHGLATYRVLEEIIQTVDQPLSQHFKISNAASLAPTFGNRGVGTTDVVYHAQIGNPPGVQPNSFFFKGTIIGLSDNFHVRSSGVTKVVLSAGPPVTNTALDALGQFCAAASSASVKENIINTTDTSFINTIQPREFNFIGDNVKQIGAVVEEMVPLIPEALRPALINFKINWAYEDQDGVYHPMTRDFTKPESINLQGVVFALLKEHQNLVAANQALAARVTLLEAP